MSTEIRDEVTEFWKEVKPRLEVVSLEIQQQVQIITDIIREEKYEKLIDAYTILNDIVTEFSEITDSFFIMVPSFRDAWLSRREPPEVRKKKFKALMRHWCDKLGIEEQEIPF